MDTSQPIRLVIFDMAGTTVDHGCMAPVSAIIEALSERGISISAAQARGPMGVHKRDHIRALLQLSDVTQGWRDCHGRDWTEEDVQQIYESLLPRQTDVALRHADAIPGSIDCVNQLRERGIAVAATTGYPRSVAQPILDKLDQQGLRFDHTFCADEVPAGRPAPWMILRNMEATGIYPPSSVVKVGDTVPDVEAGRNAGTWSVGVSETGSEFGLTVDELEALSADERDQRNRLVTEKLQQAGAHRVITSVSELPELLPVLEVASEVPQL